MVTLGQGLVLLGFFVAIVFTYGLALFVFFVQLIAYLGIPWSAGDRLLPGPRRHRGPIAVVLSIPISVVATFGGLRLALAIVGTDHDSGWPYLLDLAIFACFTAMVGAAFWSAIGAVVRRLEGA